MFSLVPQFSSLVSLIGLGGFLPGPHSSSPLTILHSAEFAFEKRGNCNNVIFGVENFGSENHVTTKQSSRTFQFDFHCNASSSLISIWSLGFLLDLCTQFLLTLCIQLLTIYAIELARHLYTSQKVIPAVISICVFSTYRGIRLLSSNVI